MVRKWLFRLTLPVLVVGGLSIGMAVPGEAADSPSSISARISHDYFLPAQPGLFTRLSLSTKRIEAGKSFRATIVITNRSGHTVDLTAANGGSRPLYTVVLENASHFVLPVFTAMADSSPLLVPPGRTTWTVQVPSVATAVPPGHYFAFLAGYKLALPPPKPVPITVVRGGV